MNSFITRHSKKLIALASALAWLGVWQLASALIDEPLFFPSLTSVLKTLALLLGRSEFYIALANSFAHIMLGYLGSVIIGAALAALAAASKVVRELLRPLMSVIKATPVASFIVLALILVSSKNLSALIAFLMAVPIVYTNTLSGVLAIDKAMFEAADVYGMDGVTRFRYIYFPETFPYFKAGCGVALGLSWKAGVAAEVIGLAANSIGGKLYDAKIYLNIPELFSYTLVIVLISIIFEKLISLFLEWLYKIVVK